MKNKNMFATCDLELKEVNDSTGEIEGLASVFKNLDLGLDIVDKGAFKKTIEGSKGLVPILDNHNPHKQIGFGLSAEEKEKGLFVVGKLLIDDIPEAKARFALMKLALSIKAKAGLSFGFETVKSEMNNETGVRHLKELKLFEWSPVTFPMNPKARVTAAKAWLENHKDLDEVCNLFVDQMKDEGHTIKEIQKALQSAAAGVNDPDDPTVQSLLSKMENLSILFKGA